MTRPIRLAFLGAGSFFAPRLLNDLLHCSGLKGGEIALVDIDAQRLELTHRIIARLIEQRGRGRWKVSASTDRTAVLAGCHYVVNCIEVSGLECVVHDNDIPLKYGVDQCIGDTIGPGGLFKALRTIPVWLEVLRDCERLCPDALVLNYTNPMGMLCLAAARRSRMRVIGLCHSVQQTSRRLADYAGVPYSELEWTCAGINHVAWFTTLRHRGVDLYRDRLLAKFALEIDAGRAEHAAGLARNDAADNSHGHSVDVRYRETDLVRKDMCLHFGAFITESSGHLSEYLPYYRKSDHGRALLRLGYDGGSRFYATNWPRWRADADAERAAILSGAKTLQEERSFEYAASIIEAIETGGSFEFHGNVLNRSASTSALISNLPSDGIVEVTCTADSDGIHPQPYGALPPAMAAICASNMAMIDLAARAACERSIEGAIAALMLDPLTAAVCTPAQIKAMTLEMFAAENAFLPGYR